MVGQLNCKDAIPLSPEFEEFVNSSAHGFVIVAFGSSFVPLTKEKVDMLALAFGKLKQKVVWRLKGKEMGCNFIIEHILLWQRSNSISCIMCLPMGHL